MSLQNKYGSWALIAGASEGIGAAFAHALAAKGIHLALVARRIEPLEHFAALLQEQYAIRTQCIACDLAAEDATAQIQTALAGQEIDILVYNAALSYIGPFEQFSDEQYTALAYANMITPLKMTKAFGESMLKRGRGAVVLMASLAGFQGSGFLAGYAASKAFDRVFAESLWYEWRKRGVDVLACCAGATATPNYLKTQPAKTSFFAPRVQTPQAVVNECFKHLGKRPSFITGRGNKMASFIMQRLMPRKKAILIMGDTLRESYKL